MESFYIYAEMSKHQREDKLFKIDLPDGVTLNRKPGSRALYFDCDSEDSQNAIIEILDDKYINWQKM